MKIDQIEFMASSPHVRKCPPGDLPEFAFIGRSNVGKSSLINMIVARKGMAKVSGTPGKTRLLNHFSVKSTREKFLTETGTVPEASIPVRQGAPFEWYLVDLPGYGFAKLSKEAREKFEGIIRTYLIERENLALTFILIDCRLEPQKIDLDFMNWLGDHDVSFIILFTKSDKLSKSKLTANLKAYQQALARHWKELPAMYPTSSRTGEGRAEVLGIIQDVMDEVGGEGD